MKRRIDQLLNEKFEYEAPQLLIEPARLYGTVRRGRNWAGSFTLTNPAQKKAKGLLYASSPRAGLSPASFHGIAEKIFFEVDMTGLSEGDTLEGLFTVCSDLGEYQIPWKVQVEGTAAGRTEEMPESLSAFAAAARKDYGEACRVFQTPAFPAFLKKEAPELCRLYEGLTAQAGGSRAMEQFLTAAAQKEPVEVTADRTEIVLTDLAQSVRETVTLTRNTWGYLRLEVSSDAPFLWVEKSIVTDEDFIGSTCQLNILVDPGRMHAGKNGGRITVRGEAKSLSVDVKASPLPVHARPAGTRGQQRAILKLENAYVDFRTRRMELGEWLAASGEAIDAYKESGGTSAWMDLFRAHLHFAKGREDEACLQLESLEQKKERLGGPALTGFYLYLTTFYHKERDYLDYVERQVEGLFLRNPEEWVLLWVLLYVEERYLRHPAEKLAALKQQYARGCHSRILYLEAAQVLERSPLLLRRLDPFEVQILHFMCRQGMLNRELAMQLAELAGRAHGFSGLLFEVLAACYESYPSRGLLSAICGLLIGGRRTESRFFNWYQLGVSEDLRLNGLYECYAESMPEEQTALPAIIRRYFSYSSSLGAEKRAALYARILNGRREDPETYMSCRPAMERFALEQLALCRVSRDLAVLYRVFLTRDTVTRGLAEQLVRVLFTYEVRCDVPGIRSVIVRHGELKEEQRTALADGRALVRIYAGSARILFADETGRRSACTGAYRTERLLFAPELLELCRELVPDSAALTLYDLSMLKPGETDIRLCRRLLALPGVREDKKAEARVRLLNDCYAHPSAYSAEDIAELDEKTFAATDRRKYTELLIVQGLYPEAFRVVSRCGTEGVDAGLLVRLCSRVILAREFAEDKMCVALCAQCLLRGKYDETVLAYLLAFYEGPIEVMKTLWKAGRLFGLDTFRLEERILSAVLFTRSGAEHTEDIFLSYRRAAGKKNLLRAYMILMCYRSFVRGWRVEEPVFAYAERLYEREDLHEEVCRLALLAYYADKKDRTQRQTEIAGALLSSFAGAGIRFGFFKKFDPELLRAFLLFDKTFLEYRTAPDATVTVRWRVERNGESGRETTETLNPLFEGIFVKEFTLFADEKLVYSVHEIRNGKTKDSGEITLVPEPPAADASLYGMINRLAEAVRKGGDTGAPVRSCLEQTSAAETIFTLM